MFRRYNRAHSRFDQPDPYEGSYDLRDPQSFNRYAYVQNDPVNFVDPSGLNEQDLTPRHFADEWGYMRSLTFRPSAGPDDRGSGDPGYGGDVAQDKGSDAERGRHLSSCVIDLLAKFFDRDLLEAIRIDRDSLIVPPTMGAITIGDNISFKKGEYNPTTLDGIAFLAHEITHSEQYRAVGVGTFLQTYTVSSALVVSNPVGLVASVIAAKQGKNLPHDMNAYEQAADAKARKVRNELARQGYGEDGQYCRD